MAIMADKLAVTVNGEKAEVSGNIDFTNRANPTAEDLSVKLESFDLSKVIPDSPVTGAVSGKLVLNGTKKNVLVKGNLTASVLVIEGETLKDVIVPLSMKDEKIMVSGATAQYSGGTVSLLGTYEQ
jgi:autotransporter translocation and assembly factor TamB